MNSKQILIVDREIHMLNLLQALLKDKYQLRLESGSLEALQWIQHGNLPDLIIAEYDMPYMNGLELVNNLKISGLYNKVPVIILSGTQGLESNMSASNQSIVAYVAKPFNPEELNLAISGAFNKYELN